MPNELGTDAMVADKRVSSPITDSTGFPGAAELTSSSNQTQTSGQPISPSGRGVEERQTLPAISLPRRRKGR